MENRNFESICSILENQRKKLQKLLAVTEKIRPELDGENLEVVENLISQKKAILTGSDAEISRLKEYLSKWEEIKKKLSEEEFEKVKSLAVEVTNLLAQIISLENESIEKISKLRDKRADELKNLMKSSNISNKYKKSNLEGKESTRFVDDKG